VRKSSVKLGSPHVFLAGPRRPGDVSAAHLKELINGAVPITDTPIIFKYTRSEFTDPVEGDLWMYTLTKEQILSLDPAKRYFFDEKCVSLAFGEGTSPPVELIREGVATLNVNA
jgi:hypothetical protein